MNNYKIALDSAANDKEFDRTPLLREKEAKLVRIMEALQGVQATQEWSTLKTEIFDDLVVQLNREILSEAKKEDPDPKKLNRITGELKWARKFSDLHKLEDEYRVELSNVRKQLYGKE